MTQKPESLEILRHLASKPGHDEVKADFRSLLVGEFDVPLADVRFEQRIEVKSRTDALIGRTVFEAKKDLVREWADVERKMPDYLRNREDETGEPFVGIASDGRLASTRPRRRRPYYDQGNERRGGCRRFSAGRYGIRRRPGTSAGIL